MGLKKTIKKPLCWPEDYKNIMPPSFSRRDTGWLTISTNKYLKVNLNLGLCLLKKIIFIIHSVFQTALFEKESVVSNKKSRLISSSFVCETQTKDEMLTFSTINVSINVAYETFKIFFNSNCYQYNSVLH